AVQHIGVGGGGGDQPGEIVERRAGELDLATRLHGDEGAAGQRIGGGRRVQGGRAMPAQGGGQPGCGELFGTPGPYQPFQLHPGEHRGTVLETHRRDVGLGRCTIVQHGRLAALFRVLRRGGGGPDVRRHARRRYPREAWFARVFGRGGSVVGSCTCPASARTGSRRDGSKSSTARAPASPRTATRVPPCAGSSRSSACPGARSSTTSATRKRSSSRSPSRTPGGWPTSSPSRASCR